MPWVFCVLLMLNCPCSASLYVVKVLRGAPAETKKDQTTEKAAASEVCSPHTDSCVTFVFTHLSQKEVTPGNLSKHLSNYTRNN